MVYLTRRYRFSAAHRLHSEALSAEENARLYGKCNNPHGHGHNYALEVTVAGPADPATGMVYDLARLDRAVRAEVLERFDEKHLNLDVENFRARVPTTENVCVEIFNLLWPHVGEGSGRTGARLQRVRLEETSSNFIEYEPEPSDPARSGKVI
ncbi:MAG: 6-carboxytetrahydropterin synthase [Acidobacteria bacterium]|nr:6-carboxytetrahydropterin synthase [Acidobacteriota bacterium]